MGGILGGISGGRGGLLRNDFFGVILTRNLAPDFGPILGEFWHRFWGNFGTIFGDIYIWGILDFNMGDIFNIIPYIITL